MIMASGQTFTSTAYRNRWSDLFYIVTRNLVEDYKTGGLLNCICWNLKHVQRRLLVDWLIRQYVRLQREIEPDVSDCCHVMCLF